jgi:dehydrogenase/reductase SDR family member 7
MIHRRLLQLNHLFCQTVSALRKMPRSGAFEKKVCWITGASSGIGEALAYELSRQGATLCLSARRGDVLSRVAADCRKLGCLQVEVVPVDLSDYPSHKAVVDRVIAKFGRIDYLVNNAGRSQRGTVEDTDPAVERAVIELNVFGTLSLTKAALPHLLSQTGGGVIVNTSSMAGKIASPVSAAYSASKHALHGYFDSLRFELACRGVRVVNVCPGPVQSEISVNAFTETVGKAHGDSEQSDGTVKMSATRCAALMAAAMHAELPEAWLAPQPLLLFLYIAQYLPGLYFRLGAKAGRQRVESFRAGRSGYSAVQNVWQLAFSAGAKP